MKVGVKTCKKTIIYSAEFRSDQCSSSSLQGSDIEWNLLEN